MERRGLLSMHSTQRGIAPLRLPPIALLKLPLPVMLLGMLALCISFPLGLPGLLPPWGAQAGRWAAILLLASLVQNLCLF